MIKNKATTLAAMSAAVLAGGEAKARVRRSQVTLIEPKKPKAPAQVSGHSFADLIRRAKTVEDVDRELEAAIGMASHASEQTKRRWARTAAMRKKELES